VKQADTAASAAMTEEEIEAAIATLEQEMEEE
jgi:hypothetical protein